ncbi:flagellar biosynthesis protein FlhA [Acutalibacter muris]|jgi:flagellar biosynthesis protein FlhA|uniref:Flagellar biosynthesis protein FlhA n=1 Tax=Acutalibacter muris TaxID=1796620 RepID=A0A1Z2XSX3_9FIRM|nr:flagellar biosynthesis protein FlhA [Acutalibacter muris]ANU55218.1 flagellar biosynthesis protein FlhA [Hungateiclostridiaceae bacterium KB18]ASB41546.1 flagellar biosynthesis protein FlhA [Acutalibacter muris]MCI9192068.1 flagellar biosynthesis protein FlhA [Acutalibacter muris]MCI9543608.1 flagellar biosynthesis protein FlhA [Acutalibacter muris]QQR30808.1 flagellar biosynthesis protein FlhA [Acutalibacter muris]
MKRILNNSISLFVVVVVLFLILPLPTFLLDILLVINISLSIVILLITMNIKETLEFSIYPSLLLITTLFRLGLNVSSTRMILRDGFAGDVIAAFGQLITSGNVVIGFIIFFIIVMVQFIVITKGAERVAEVAARFTLDAMPGKQMAIDADLNTGLIDEQQARIRREKIQREADFYGAMDGATKIVKGDAVMSLIITAVNLIGGVIIGMVSRGMDIGTVFTEYSIVTIGDGLVSQLPALMISTATGMIVTRSVSDGSLNTDMIKQFTAQPRAIITAGAALIFLALMPNTPHLALGVVAAILIVFGLLLSRKMRAEQQAQEALEAPSQEPEPEAAPAEADYYRDVSNVYSLLTVEPIEMEVGYSLIPLVDESSGGKLINRIVIFRRQYAQEMGFVVPTVRMHDSSVIGTNQYTIRIKGEEVAKGEILVDYYLALEPSKPLGEIDGIETVEPAYGIPSRWILPENKEMAEIYGYTVIDPLSVVLTHLSETIKKHAYELLTRTETIQLVENLKKTSPELVEEACPSVISYALLEKVLRNLLMEGIPIRDMQTILETMVDAMGTTRDPDLITESVRNALSRTITRRFCEDGQLRAITLDAEVERRVVASLTKNEHGIYLAMEPDLIQALITQLAEHMPKFAELGQPPILLTSQVVRIYLSRLLSQYFANLYVLSFSEIVGTVQIQSLGNVTMQQSAARRAVGT